MRKCLLLALLVAASSSFAQVPGTPELIAQQLARHAVVHGKFVQTRQIKGIEEALRANGEYIFWRNQGIYWAMLHPLEKAITYRNDATLQWSNKDAQPVEVNNNADRHIRKILMTVFSFDRVQLDQEFEQQWAIESEHWKLSLTPKQMTTRRFVREINLQGSNDIDRLSVHHANGEVLTIEFIDNQPTHSLDHASCINYFDYSDTQCEQLLNATDPQP